METVKSLNDLLVVVKEAGKVPVTMNVLYGGTQVRHKLWTASNQNGELFYGYGISTLLPVVIEQDINFDTIRFNGVSRAQFNNMVFSIDMGDKEDMITISTKLDTPQVGNRQVCGEDCDKHDHGQVDVKKEVINEPTKDEQTGIVKPEVETTLEGESEGDSEGTVENTEGTESTEPTPESGTLDSDTLPDFEHAQSLYDESDKSGSKVKLEEYAREFGAELQRNKTFDNMMLDFKAAFE